MRCPSQPLYTRPGSRESIYVYICSFLTLTCSVRQVSHTFLVSRGLLCRCQLAGQGDPCDSSVGLLSSGTPGRPIVRSRGVTPSSTSESVLLPRTFDSFCCWIHNACYMVESYVKVHIRSHVHYMVHLYSSIKTLLVIFGFHPLYNF